MPPWTPIREAGSIVSEGREVWVKIRASKAERAEWHAKARSVGLSLSDLVRRSVGRVRTWTVAHAELERGHCQVNRFGAYSAPWPLPKLLIPR